jgi:CheY-like chemotaxis protein
VIDLGELVSESQRLLAALVPERITLELTIDAPVRVAAEPSEVQQVLLNLVNNAAQAMPNGGVVRLVVGPYRHVDDLAGTTLAGVAAVVRLGVTDTGIGMDRATRARIFEPFYTTKAPNEGTGLGLSTVQATVAALGGLVRVDSAPGQGTCMEVLLPAVDAVVDAVVDGPPTGLPHRAVVTPTSNRALGRAIVIDDEPAVLAGTARLLSRLGFVVASFTDPSAALRQLETDSGVPDLVLTDLAMFGMSGWEVARQVIARHPDVPVVVMTGHVAVPDAELASHPGVRAVLAKPFTAAELQATLQTTLQMTLPVTFQATQPAASPASPRSSGPP